MVEQLDGKLLNKALYIVSGEEMKKNFGACAVPFNEAMCQGGAVAEIFGKEFVEKRALCLHTDESEYREKVLTPLAPFFALPQSVGFVFGQDMFCAINLLTLAAYLDKVGYKGETEAILLKDEMDFGGEKQVFANIADNAFASYEELVLKGRMPQTLPAFLSRENAERYLDYRAGGKIAEYIRAHAGEKDLLFSLMQKFSAYGLGEIQYLEMIKKYA